MEDGRGVRGLEDSSDLMPIENSDTEDQTADPLLILEQFLTRCVNLEVERC